MSTVFPAVAPGSDDALLANPGLLDRVEAMRFALTAGSLLRVPAVLLLIDGFLAWQVWLAGWPAAALVWFVLMGSMHCWRWVMVRRWQRHPPADKRRANDQLATMVVGLAALLALATGLVFAGSLVEQHYAITTVSVGMASGAVVATAWQPRVFGLWSLLVGGSLVAGWLLQGHAVGSGLAVLIACLFGVLYAQSRDQQRAMHRMVSLAWDNEQLAASLRAERDKANAASESKTRFFAAASHDLRQPLQALSISAYALAMLARREGQPKMVKMADNIERALRQSTGLLDGLLDVSRLDAGAVKVDWRNLHLAPMLDSLASEFRPLAAQGGLTLTVQLPTGPLTVYSDADLLRRVLTNLLGNALKFTRSGGVRLEADRADDGRVRLAVVDTGIGIAVADQARVFEEFYQADNPARDRSLGLGLGLSIVRRIAVLLEAGLQLHSQLGQGTRVELLLPPGHPAASPAHEAPALLDVTDPGVRVGGLPVLVIDDEPDIREAMQSLLEQMGCVAVCAENQAEALTLVRAGFRPAVILADHRLREGDGLSALAALRAELGQVATLVVTGDTAPHTLASILASGHRVLHKPVDGATLARALREVTATGG